MTIAHPAQDSRTRERLTREARGIALFEERSGEIQQLRVGLYSVPKCSGRGDYLVEYGAGVESCACKDFELRGSVYPCKHLYAAALFFAARRRAIRRMAAVLADGE